MARGDYCAVYGCSNYRRYPEKQVVVPHVGILRFYAPLNMKDVAKWEKLLNCRDFKVKTTTKVCSNHFTAGYRSKECPYPSLYLKGYAEKKEKRRPSPRKRDSLTPKTKKRRRNNEVLQTPESEPSKEDNDNPTSDQEDPSESETYTAPVDEKTQMRSLFIEQVTCEKKCFRYTGLSRPMLDLVIDLIKEKAKNLRYWRGSIDTGLSRRRKKKAQPRYLSSWEELILTLVRTRKGSLSC